MEREPQQEILNINEEKVMIYKKPAENESGSNMHEHGIVSELKAESESDSDMHQNAIIDEIRAESESVSSMDQNGLTYEISPDEAVSKFSGGIVYNISPDGTVTKNGVIIEDENIQAPSSKCDIFGYSCIAFSIIFFPIMTREVDALETAGLCEYDLMPFIFIFISCIGNLTFLVLLLFTEDVFNFFKATICCICSSCRSTKTAEVQAEEPSEENKAHSTHKAVKVNAGESVANPPSEASLSNTVDPTAVEKTTSVSFSKKALVILKLMLFLLSVFLFAYRLVKDFSIIHNFEDTAWGRYQCYGLIIYNSANFRCAMFSFFSAPIQYVGLYWRGRQKTNNAWSFCLDICVFYWNIFIGVFYFILLIPMFLTHLWPSLVIFIWMYVFFRLITIVFIYFCTPIMIGEKKVPSVNRFRDVMDPYSSLMFAMNDIVLAKCIAITGVVCIILGVVFFPIQFEMTARFYNGAGYGEAIRNTWGTRRISDFVESFQDDFILAVRNFI